MISVAEEDTLNVSSIPCHARYDRPEVRWDFGLRYENCPKVMVHFTKTRRLQLHIRARGDGKPCFDFMNNVKYNTS